MTKKEKWAFKVKALAELDGRDLPNLAGAGYTGMYESGMTPSQTVVKALDLDKKYGVSPGKKLDVTEIIQAIPRIVNPLMELSKDLKKEKRREKKFLKDFIGRAVSNLNKIQKLLKEENKVEASDSVISAAGGVQKRISGARPGQISMANLISHELLVDKDYLIKFFSGVKTNKEDNKDFAEAVKSLLDVANKKPKSTWNIDNWVSTLGSEKLTRDGKLKLQSFVFLLLKLNTPKKKWRRLIDKTSASGSIPTISNAVSAAGGVRRSKKKLQTLLDTGENAGLIFKQKLSEKEQTKVVNTIRSWASRKFGKAARARMLKNERFYNKWVKKPDFDNSEFFDKLEEDLNDIANYRLNY